MKDGLFIHTDYCLTPNTTLHNAAVVLRNGRIHAIGGRSAFVNTENYDCIDMPDCYMLPGLVDTHLYGAGGFDCMHADTDQNIAGMSRILAEHGVTTFVPTTQSCPREKLVAVVQSLAGICGQDMPGAIPAGLSIEGPYLSPAKPGAHLTQHIRDIDLDEVRELIAIGKDCIRIFTFAPEKPQALQLIELLLEADIMPCMGHTVATEAEIRAAIDAGARRCSHLYNGMDPLKNRQLGLAAVALTDERVWVELITDGVHIHPGMIDLACRCKPKDHLIGISNSTEAAGLKDGVYKLGQATIVVTGGRSMLRGGVLAGSVSFLDLNYDYLRKNTHLTAEETAACFTLNACRSIGLFDRGELKPGKRGDLVIMNHANEVQMTIVGGRIVYDRNRIGAGMADAGLAQTVSFG